MTDVMTDEWIAGIGAEGIRLRYVCRSINAINHRLGYDWCSTRPLISPTRVIMTTENPVVCLMMNDVIIGKCEKIV